MRSFDEELLERVRSYRGTRPYEKALRKSKVWVEPMFGEAKQWHGMRRFRLRTLRRVNAEALLIATGQNIKRLLTFSGMGPRKMAQVEALRPPAPTSWANGRLLQGSHRRRSTPLLARFSTRWGVLRSIAVRVAPVPFQPDGSGTIWFVTFTERPKHLTLVFDGA